MQIMTNVTGLLILQVTVLERRILAEFIHFLSNGLQYKF